MSSAVGGVREVWADNAGVRIEALEWDAPGARGLPLVVVGGGTGTAWSAEPIAALAAAGRLGRLRRVLGVSRRGMGRSAAPPSGYAPADFARDVGAAIAAAGHSRFALYGHSMGVPISLRLALDRPGGLAGLILGDAPAEYVDFTVVRVFDAIVARHRRYPSLDAAFEALMPAGDDRGADRARFDRARHRILREVDGAFEPLFDRGALERTVAESARAAESYWERLGSIEVPTLFLKATRGWALVTDEQVARYQATMRDLEVARLPTGHGLGISWWADEAPDAFAAAVGPFLDRLDGA